MKIGKRIRDGRQEESGIIPSSSYSFNCSSESFT
jgi:hypothetical protein